MTDYKTEMLRIPAWVRTHADTLAARSDKRASEIIRGWLLAGLEADAKSRAERAGKA